MLNFCTLFDSNYMSRGIAMYESLKKYCSDFHLYIFAFDEKCFDILQKLNLADVTLVSLKEFENTELLRVKKTRSRAEYCWTCTSSTILYVLKNFNVDCCTYLDADIYWFNSPESLFNELGDNSIIITKHNYTDNKYGRNAIKTSGIYCVQFVTFKNDSNGLTALNWWCDRCIEWCFNRNENGKFGDQKYLDDWTDRFKGVHVLKHLGGGAAPWNVQQYDICQKKDVLYGIDKKSKSEFPIVFFHFHYLKFFNDETVELGLCELSDNVKNYIYKPYIMHLEEAKKKIINIDNTFDPHGTVNKKWNLKEYYELLKRKIKGNYNVYPKRNFFGEGLNG